MKSIPKTCVVIPNLNGLDSLQDCLTSLKSQTLSTKIIVVENASTDGSAAWLSKHHPDIIVLPQTHNLGFAGGVNAGIRYALEAQFDSIALFNNDAVAEPDWLERLVRRLNQSAKTGIVTGTFMAIDKQHLDSTGDIYTSWGLPYPRGRGEAATTRYPADEPIFGASGGASLYRSEMLQQIGLFDEDFFAYYEDVDISFRAQLNGWLVAYEPTAVAYHQIGATSSKIKGFTTKQTIKNYPWLLIKNVPRSLLPTVTPRFMLAYVLFIGRAVQRGHYKYAAQGLAASLMGVPTKVRERRRIQANRTVGDDYIWNLMTHDLPPNATALRKLRNCYWKLNRKRT